MLDPATSQAFDVAPGTPASRTHTVAAADRSHTAETPDRSYTVPPTSRTVTVT